MMKVGLATLSLPVLFFFSLARSEELVLEPIIVTATRIPTVLPRLVRSVSIIEADQIEDAPVTSVPELLGYVMGVDVRRRGVYGVQADVSIRGSHFEQVLILVDGIKVNDPQTGHHNMDLPLSLSDIERIEVLRGHGSSLYGPNAFGGVINIVTKRPEGRGAKLEFRLGENSLSSGALSLTYALGRFSNRLSFERKESSGYRRDTEFDINTLALTSTIEIPRGSLDLALGFTEKDFGANSFYSTKYPYQEEHTDTSFGNIRARIDMGNITLEPMLYYRRHWDKYILDRYNPNFYTNRHTTHLYGGELQSHISLVFGSFVLGAEIGKEEIDSTNLGVHSRSKEAIYIEFEPKLANKFILNLGMRGDHYSEWGWEGCPTLSAGYRVSPYVKLRGSIGRSFRVPTYTDLYYVSPANVGNPDLVPERAWSYEMGVDYNREDIYWGVTLFRREGSNLIDWIWRNSTWEAENIGEVDTDGLEAAFKIKFDESLPISSVSLGYTYLDSEKKTGITSKYVLNYLKHQICLEFDHMLPLEARQVWKLSYKDRVQGDEYWLLDSRISKKLENGKEIFVEGTNLLDTSYSEQGGVPMPGRWVQGGMKVEF